MQELQRTVAETGGISYWVIKKKQEKNLCPWKQDWLVSSVRVCVCVCVCVCTHSWVCTMHACMSGWMSVSESCVFVQSLPEVV